MSIFVIASRKPRRRGKPGTYRTRYYRECVDGVAKFTTKAMAGRFNEDYAGKILEQLRRIQPHTTFTMMPADARPSRAKDAGALGPPVPTQLDALEALEKL